jgi:hypothetical protein
MTGIAIRAYARPTGWGIKETTMTVYHSFIGYNPFGRKYKIFPYGINNHECSMRNTNLIIQVYENEIVTWIDANLGK